MRPFLFWGLPMICRFPPFAALIAVLLLAPSLAWGQGAPVLRDLADAGSVRLQGQRLAKLYLQAGQNINGPAAMRLLGAAEGQIDGELGRLERYSRQPGSQRSYVRCAEIWQELRATLTQPYGTASAERVSQLAEELAIHAGRLVLQIESAAEGTAGRQVDGASRLNMLAQRLGRLYMQVQGGDRTQGLLVDMEQTRKEFATGLAELESAPANSPTSRERLALARNQWIFFDAAVRQAAIRGGDAKAPLHVATSSERIQEMLASVTTQYVQDFAATGKAR